jgi:hypothetical protein
MPPALSTIKQDSLPKSIPITGGHLPITTKTVPNNAYNSEWDYNYYIIYGLGLYSSSVAPTLKIWLRYQPLSWINWAKLATPTSMQPRGSLRAAEMLNNNRVQ